MRVQFVQILETETEGIVETVLKVKKSVKAIIVEHKENPFGKKENKKEKKYTASLVSFS